MTRQTGALPSHATEVASACTRPPKHSRRLQSAFHAVEKCPAPRPPTSSPTTSHALAAAKAIGCGSAFGHAIAVAPLNGFGGTAGQRTALAARLPLAVDFPNNCPEVTGLPVPQGVPYGLINMAQVGIMVVEHREHVTPDECARYRRFRNLRLSGVKLS